MLHRRLKLLQRRLKERKIIDIDVIVVSYDGATYFVPKYAINRTCSRRILEKSYFEPMLHQFIGKMFAGCQGNMVHAGTFFGDMLPSFSMKVSGTIYAFEPVLENYIIAKKTVDQNRLDNVILYHAGLGAASSSATIITGTADQHFGGGSFIETSDDTRPSRLPTGRLAPNVLQEKPLNPTTQRIPVLSIDQMEIENLMLIQLDVEGFELEVLKGAKETIKTQEPAIIVEDDRKNCEEFLKSIGYELIGGVATNQLYLSEKMKKMLGSELISSINS